MPDKYDLTPACTLQGHPGARFISWSKSTHTRVQPVGLRTAGQVLHVAGVDQPRVQPAGLQQVEHRLPVVGGGLHNHPGHAQLDEPVSQHQQARGQRGAVHDLLLAATGTVLGLAIGIGVCRLPIAMLPPTPVPLVLDMELDEAMLAFSACSGIFAALLYGTGSVWRAWKSTVNEVRIESVRVTERGFGRKLLVAGQLALSLVLLAGAGLFLKTLHSLAGIDLGFVPKQLMAFEFISARHAGGVPTARGEGFARQIDWARRHFGYVLFARHLRERRLVHSVEGGGSESCTGRFG